MEPLGETALIGITVMVMVVGMIGLIVPIFPGILVIWLAALFYGLNSGFGVLGTILFIVITLLMIFGSLIDNIMLGAGARKGGAAWTTIALAIVAGVVGTIIVPPIGGLIAAPLVFSLLEYRRLQNWDQTWQSLRSMATSWGLSLVIRFFVGLIMIGGWVIWAMLG